MVNILKSNGLFLNGFEFNYSYNKNKFINTLTVLDDRLFGRILQIIFRSHIIPVNVTGTATVYSVSSYHLRKFLEKEAENFKISNQKAWVDDKIQLIKNGESINNIIINSLLPVNKIDKSLHNDFKLIKLSSKKNSEFNNKLFPIKKIKTEQNKNEESSPIDIFLNRKAEKKEKINALQDIFNQNIDYPLTKRNLLLFIKNDLQSIVKKRKIDIPFDIIYFATSVNILYFYYAIVNRINKLFKKMFNKIDLPKKNIENLDGSFVNPKHLEENIKRYLDLFYEKYPEMNQKKYSSALQFTALLIALKTYVDFFLYNSDLAPLVEYKIGYSEPENIKLKMKHMEQAFLEVLEWKNIMQNPEEDSLPNAGPVAGSG